MGDNPAIRSGAFLLSSSHYGNLDSSYWAVMAEDLCAALRQAGQDCRTLNPSAPGIDAVFDAVLSGGGQPDYLVTFNLMPDVHCSGEWLWGLSRIPLIVLCLDHPLHLARNLTALLAQAPKVSPRWLHWIGIMEDGHRQFLEGLGWPKDRIFVFSQGGPPPGPCRPQHWGRASGP